MTDELIRWVAESDPIVVVEHLGIEHLYCWYCKKDWPEGEAWFDGDWHAPGCWYMRCMEQVMKRTGEEPED